MPAGPEMTRGASRRALNEKGTRVNDGAARVAPEANSGSDDWLDRSEGVRITTLQ